MLEKIKEVPFIDESAAVRVYEHYGQVILERFDRVVWAKEVTPIRHEYDFLGCYVEASKFFALLPEIESFQQDTCLRVTLKNGAKYELPFMDVSWDTVQMPDDYDDTITFKLSDLMLSTLRNLIKPELQCIYIDDRGAVSCDFITACISEEVKSRNPFMLPPDIQPLVDGRTCKVKVADRLYVQTNDFSIATTVPAMPEDGTWEQLRAMLPATSDEMVDGTPLVDSLKRLLLFGDYVTFDGTRVISERNSEPFVFSDTEESRYEIERLLKILATAKAMSEHDKNLIFANDGSRFLLSPMEEA